MNEMPFQVKGWCPGARQPMESGDGFILRIKPFLGIINREQAQNICNIAREYGVDQIDITSKANVQIRGVQEENIKNVNELLADSDLLDASIALESRRNIVVNPMFLLTDVRPQVELIYAQLVQALDNYDHSVKTPAKFSYLIDDYDEPLLAKVSADVRIEVCRERESRKKCHDLNVCLSFSGTGNTSTGSKWLPVKEAVNLSMAASLEFFDSGLERSQFKHWIECYLDRTNLQWPAEIQNVRDQNNSRFSSSRNLIASYDLYARKYKFSSVSRRFGEFSANQWQEIVEVMTRIDLDELIVTPHKYLILPEALDRSDVNELQRKYSTSVLDSSLIACPGTPACQSAQGATRGLFDYLGLECGELLDGTVNVHISGCRKGCAHSTSAELTILVESEGFRLGLGRSAREVDSELLSKNELTMLLNQLRERYKQDKNMYRDAAEFIEALVQQEQNIPA